jgi:hypothetical protein
LELAEAALQRVRSVIKDAHLKKCDIKPGSLLALRISAVDPSIAAVPKDSVNWADTDRVSSILPVAGVGPLVIIRNFVPTPDDPMEGRRERVVFVTKNGNRVVLSENCYSLGHPSFATGGMIAFECAREQAGPEILHSVVVARTTGQSVKEVEHCRDPIWLDRTELLCKSESVDAHGKLQLKAERFRVSSE